MGSPIATSLSGSTMPDGIQVGAQVYGIFLDGKHSQSPLILGSIPQDSGMRVIVDEPSDSFALAKPSKSESNIRIGDEVTKVEADKLVVRGPRRQAIEAWPCVYRRPDNGACVQTRGGAHEQPRQGA